MSLLSDPVNHPKHYTSRGIECPGCRRQIECIDIVRHFSFAVGNAIKYLWRHAEKNGKQDLDKAIWYIKDEQANLYPGEDPLKPGAVNYVDTKTGRPV